MPKITCTPTIGAKFLLSYDLDKNWIPSRQSQFYMIIGTSITAIVLIVAAGLLGIMYLKYKLLKPQSELVTIRNYLEDDNEYKFGS